MTYRQLPFNILFERFREVLEQHNRLNEKIYALSKDTEIAETKLNELHAMIVNAEIPPGLDRDINVALDKIRAVCGEHCFFCSEKQL